MTALALHLPSPEQSRQAARALLALAPAGESRSAAQVRLVGGGEERSVEIPADALAALMQVLGHMAEGDAVTVVPVQSEVTAQQAADILGVSRPFLIGLIDQGKIACRRVGTHRRIPLADLLAFKEASKAERRALADQLTEEAQALGFGYE
jgi:excisionase family DNA binding protein